MIYLGYTFEPTDYALVHLDAFWGWMQEREPWFYRNLDMVRGTSWRVEKTRATVRIHHLVEFDNETALAEYRSVIAEKAQKDPAWEMRRVEQDVWYRITARTIQMSPPVRMGLHPHAATADGRGPAEGGHQEVQNTDQGRGNC
ncbi:hypothetical protein JK364_22995 [Streptomyces sp. 110]|uniref:NIPSNAP domain-containing protein n=1 Tax=Streptomyces endocoffeicus TaxID=2898945 RepID=A0ABS1PS49_9ACTN|nr:hypothetical protein [Streptomyces endocoffeicus]MBL1115242.1 hypothetical protein [Streptomyces endocoffeicus]